MGRPMTPGLAPAGLRADGEGVLSPGRFSALTPGGGVQVQVEAALSLWCHRCHVGHPRCQTELHWCPVGEDWFVTTWEPPQGLPNRAGC